jgi:hypothetical protein
VLLGSEVRVTVGEVPGGSAARFGGKGRTRQQVFRRSLAEK